MTFVPLLALLAVANPLDGGLSVNTQVGAPGLTVPITVHFSGFGTRTPVAAMFDITLPPELTIPMNELGKPQCQLVGPAVGAEKELFGRDVFADGRVIRLLVVSLDGHKVNNLLEPGDMVVCDTVVAAEAGAGFYPIVCENAQLAGPCLDDCWVPEAYYPPCSAGGIMVPPTLDTPLACAADGNLDRRVTINEVIAAVNASLNGCTPEE